MTKRARYIAMGNNVKAARVASGNYDLFSRLSLDMLCAGACQNGRTDILMQKCMI